MPYYIARCQWRGDEPLTEPAPRPDAWSLLDEEFYSRAEAEEAAREDRLQQMQRRSLWMGVHRLGLLRLDYRYYEAENFDHALAAAERNLSGDKHPSPA